MSQVTIYLPDEVAARARREAKRAGLSLSAFIASALERRAGSRGGWSKEFLSTFGEWAGPLDVEELKLEQRESLD